MDNFVKIPRNQVLFLLQIVALATSLSGVHANPFANKSILVVEDRESTRKIYKNLFQLFGFTEVVTAEHGDMALQIIADRGADFDAVFTDNEMGVHMDGVTLATNLRSRKSRSKIYLHSGNPPRDQDKLNLFDRVFLKGVNLEVVKAEIVAALQTVEDRLAKVDTGMTCTEEFEAPGRDPAHFKHLWD